MHSNVGFLATLDASMLSQRWPLVYQQAVHFLFWHCKYKPDGTGARRVFEHFSCTSNRSHQCDDLPRSFAGWVFMVFGCRFIRSHLSFSAIWWKLLGGPHNTGGGRYITNCFEYKDAVGYVSVSIVQVHRDNVLSFMRRLPEGWSLSRTPPTSFYSLVLFLGAWYSPGLQFYGLLAHPALRKRPSGVEERWPWCAPPRWFAVAWLHAVQPLSCTEGVF